MNKVDINDIKDTDLLTDDEAAKVLGTTARVVGDLRRGRKIGSFQITPKVARISGRHLREFLTKAEKPRVVKHRKTEGASCLT